jgi:hypothetical protein
MTPLRTKLWSFVYYNKGRPIGGIDAQKTEYFEEKH